MAASFSRADPTSPPSVADATFSTARKGYSPDEVRGFLAAVSAELHRAQERERELIAELRDVQSQPPADVALDDETAAKLLGEETLRVLHTARESASEIKIRAEEQAARIMRDAHDEVNRLRQEAEVEAARRRQDASSDAEAEVALAKQQGREMVNEARAYRERVLADLDRRTNLARKQIEELAHGRDRLLQVFERARLVAVDVTSNLQAIEGPDELVNLAPTTGPVPLMVPADAGAITTVTTPDLDEVDAVDDEFDAQVDVAEETGTAHDDVGESLDPADTDTGDATGDAIDEELDVDEPGEDVADDAAADDAADDPADDATDDATDDAADGEAEAPAGPADTEDPNGNVVSLFPSSGEADGAATTDDGAEPGADPSLDAPHDPAEVIFARLRAGGDAAGDPTEEGDDSADDVPDTPFGRRDEAIAPLAAAGARRLKRVLADEQNEVLDALRRGDAVAGVDDLVGAASDQDERYLGALDDQLGAAAAAGAGELGASDTTTLRASLHGAGALDGAKAMLGGSIVEPLRQRLATAIADADGDHDDLTHAVRAIYREWKTQQIDAHLDDVLRAAYAGAITAGIEPGAATVWECDPGAAPCPDCEDNSLAGEVVVGEPFPTGHQAAPAHAGCRCLTLPVSR